MKTNYLIIAGIIIVISVVSILISTTQHSQDYIFQQDTHYSNLSTRNTYISVNVAIEPFPDKVCYNLSEEEFEEFPKMIKESMLSAREEVLEPEQIAEYGDNYFFFEDVRYFEGTGGIMPPTEALDFLKKHNSFKIEKIGTNQNIKHIEDATYDFQCDVSYNDHQYRIEFRFEPLYPSWENFVILNITKNESGIPAIQKPDITVYESFNATVLFANNLDHDITLSRQNGMINNRGASFDEITIPAGQSWPYMLRTWNLDEKSNQFRSIPFVYEIQPGNLIGKIDVKNYPRCMTQQQATSLYSQVGMEITYPSYIPAGYDFECGIQNMNSLFQTVYLDQKLQSEYNDPVNAAYSRQFFADGGIRIDYSDDYILGGWQTDENYNKYQKILEQTQYSWLMTTYIDDHPVLLKVEAVRDEDTGKPVNINHLEVFLDGQKSFRIQSGLSFTELTKIAESIVFQVKPEKSTITSHVVIRPSSANPEQQENFEPENITVVIGYNNTVQWTNNDDTLSSVVPDNHNDSRFSMALSREDSDSHPIGTPIYPGDYSEYTFTKPGTFGYHSDPHPCMTGSVTVLLPEDIQSDLHKQELTVDVDDLKDTYQSGEPILFEIFAKGHVPDYSFPQTTILSHDDNLVLWKSNDLAIIGGPDIGYVSYRWFSKDIGIPTIKDPGKYKLIVWWLDKSIEHEFTVLR